MIAITLVGLITILCNENYHVYCLM